MVRSLEYLLIAAVLRMDFRGPRARVAVNAGDPLLALDVSGVVGHHHEAVAVVEQRPDDGSERVDPQTAGLGRKPPSRLAVPGRGVATHRELSG